jgi:hypothetical protein
MPDLFRLLGVGLLPSWLAVLLCLGRQRERPTETPAVCAWCQWRAEDDCAHPDSPPAAGDAPEVLLRYNFPEEDSPFETTLLLPNGTLFQMIPVATILS